MAIKLTSTSQAQTDQGIKVLVHGPAGAGKTTLCSTLPGKPVIISAEGGLLSLRHFDIPVIEVKSLQDVKDAYVFITTDPSAAEFDTVALDSISEIAEVCLAYEKANNKDARMAYGALTEQMNALIRAFRDLPGKNVYFSCKQAQTKDDVTGAMLYSPSLPGAKLGQGIGYFFDLVMALRVERDTDGNVKRYLQTGRDFQYEAKDRSGSLDFYEAPDLGAIFEKIKAPAAK